MFLFVDKEILSLSFKKKKKFLFFNGIVYKQQNAKSSFLMKEVEITYRESTIF